MAWPTPEDAWSILQEADPPTWVLEHCRCVACLAAAFADLAAGRGHSIDRDEVVAAAMLHDIGRSVTQDVRHAYVGADLLRDQGLPEALCRVVETHTGGGIAPEEARRLGLPERDYVPATLAEKIVAHADNCYSGAKRLDRATLRAKYRAKGLPEAWGTIERLDADLDRMLGEDPFQVAPADLTTWS